MAVVRFLQGTAGRSVRGVAGGALVGVGAWLGGPWWALAAVGLVPLGAAIGRLCLFAPLLRQPLRQAARPEGS